MQTITAFVLVLAAMTIGDLVSTKTKAFVPSVFVTAIVFVIGFWTVFPTNPDIVTIATLGQPAAGLIMLLLITHMGTMMSIKELVAQWKTVVIALFGIVGICAGVMLIGAPLFGKTTAIIAAPPLTGGLVASVMMSEAAKAMGMADLSVLAILVYVAQGFAGYPITAIMLKKEGTRLLNDFRSGKVVKSNKEEVAAAQAGKSKMKIIPDIPDKWNTTYMILLRLGIIAFLAFECGMLQVNLFGQEYLSKYVICLIFGVIAAEIGFLDRKPLNKCGAFGWTMTLLMAFIFGGLAQATPAMLKSVAVPLIGIIIFGVIGMMIFSMVVGKLLHNSIQMSFAVSLTALYGFPPNFILTEEAIKALTDDPTEREYLTDIMMPQMLVGGFTTVTIASVIIAGIFINML